MENLKLNPDYNPKLGDYFSDEDWTNGEIQWLATNSPSHWWYDLDSKRRNGFNIHPVILYSYGSFGTANIEELSDFSRRLTKDKILVADTIEDVEEQTYPLLQPSPRSKKVYVADLSKDILDIWIGTLTHGAPYTPLYEGKTAIDVRTDDGKVLLVGKQWFKEVYLYDEDEALLTCRDIEFKEGDYIDLRKHTPEQIRHIAEYYRVFKLEETLGELDWNYLLFYPNDGDFAAVIVLYDEGSEYTYDDIFYLEES